MIRRAADRTHVADGRLFLPRMDYEIPLPDFGVNGRLAKNVLTGFVSLLQPIADACLFSPFFSFFRLLSFLLLIGVSSTNPKTKTATNDAWYERPLAMRYLSVTRNSTGMRRVG